MALAAGPSVFGLFDGPVRELRCAGCGDVLPALSPLDAAAIADSIQRRRSELLALPDAVLDRRLQGGPSARELMEAAAAALDSATQVLHDGATPAPDDLVVALGAFSEDRWGSSAMAGPGAERTPAGLIWLALHHAAHHLEDAELTVAAMTRGLGAPGPRARAATTIIDLRPPSGHGPSAAVAPR
jgi:hypothetical protein